MIMSSDEFCQDCIGKHDCQSVYKQLGDSPGESVTIKVVLAFLLPLIVFIVSLAVFDKILAGAINIEAVHIALSFLLALLTSFVCVLIARMISKQFGLYK